jgi:hypothetical protein
MDPVHLGIPSASKGEATILPATGEALRRTGKGELGKNWWIGVSCGGKMLCLFVELLKRFEGPDLRWFKFTVEDFTRVP